MCAEDASAFLEKLDAKASCASAVACLMMQHSFGSARHYLAKLDAEASVSSSLVGPAKQCGRRLVGAAPEMAALEQLDTERSCCALLRLYTPALLTLPALHPLNLLPSQNRERARRGEPPSRPLVLTSKSRAGALAVW